MSSYSGVSENLFMNPEQAVRTYELEQRPPGPLISDLERDLYDNAIAKIRIPISSSDFDYFGEVHEECVEEYPTIMGATYHKVDSRFGNDAGHVRKDCKFNDQGVQIQDGKYLFHFNEHARERWQEQFTKLPVRMKEFLDAGYEIHDALIRVAYEQFGQLEETHPNIRRAHFLGSLGNLVSHSYFRSIGYDGYVPQIGMGEVAKPHFDIGEATIQAYADAPGFWGASGNADDDRTYYNTETGMGYFFMGMGHRKLYGNDARPKPLYHGVDRIIPVDSNWVPKRKAHILFIDAPYIDCGVTASDTIPYSEQPS